MPYIVFASSSTVYGDAGVVPTPEDYHPLEPISVYGACKLAGLWLVTLSCTGFVLRYANVIGPRGSGVVVDFVGWLRGSPGELVILGDGTQRKSYIHVYDAVDATLHLLETFRRGGGDYDVYNVGSGDWIAAREIADMVVEEMGLGDVRYVYRPGTRDGRGWPGDVKAMLLDISKLRGTGWRPRWNSREAVRKTIREILGKG